MYIASMPIAAGLFLSISWVLIVVKDQLNKQNLDVSYFSYFMDQKSAQNYVFVSYLFYVRFEGNIYFLIIKIFSQWI